jgi:hypothetical protein
MFASSRPDILPKYWLVFLLAGGAVLYLLTRQHVFTIDSLYYLWGVEHADWRYLLHPHHLLQELALRGWWRLWQGFGWTGGAILPIQVGNVLVTLAFLALAARLLDTVLQDRRWVVQWLLLLAFSYLVWHQATQAEGLPLFSLGAVACLLWTARLPLRSAANPPTGRTALALAGLIAFAVLVHQSLVLWAPLLAAMLAREAPAGRRLQLAGLALGAAGGLVLGCYLAAAFLVHGSLSPPLLAQWFTTYSREFAGRCGSLALLCSIDIFRGSSAAFLSGSPLKPYVFGAKAVDPLLVVRLLPFGLLGFVLLSGLLKLPSAYRRRDGAERRMVLYLALLALVGALFAGWWEPGNRKFWAPILPALVALAALGWQAWSSSGTRPRPILLGRPQLGWLLVGVLFAHNLFGSIWPCHRLRDDRQPLLVYLTQQTSPRDTVILPEGRTWQCAVYFQPDLPVHGIPGPWSNRDDSDHAVFRRAVASARESLRDGHTLLISACQWPRVRAELAPDLGRLPAPVPVMKFVDLDQGLPEQQLLAVRMPPPGASSAGLLR